MVFASTALVGFGYRNIDADFCCPLFGMGSHLHKSARIFSVQYQTGSYPAISGLIDVVTGNETNYATNPLRHIANYGEQSGHGVSSTGHYAASELTTLHGSRLY